MQEIQTLLDSCVGDEIEEVDNLAGLLQRVFASKDQTDRLHRFLRSKYGSQFHSLLSPTVNYFVRNFTLTISRRTLSFQVIYQCKPPQQCDAFLVLIFRSDQNYLVKSRLNPSSPSLFSLHHRNVRWWDIERILIVLHLLTYSLKRSVIFYGNVCSRRKGTLIILWYSIEKWINAIVEICIIVFRTWFLLDLICQMSN